ncbi:putative reverse transcriptase domain-containing protein [Tanacetum coccineum]
MRQRRWIKLFSDYECKIRYHPGKANVVADALSRKERVKPKRVRAMAMTIQSEVKGMILVAQGEAFNQENVFAERYSVYPGADQMYYDRRDKYWWPGMKRDIATYHPQADGQREHMIQTLEDIMRARVIDFGGSYQLSIRCAPFEALYGRKCRSPVLCAENRESSLIGPELVLETTNKVVLIKENLKATRDRQKSYVDFRRKPLESEVGDRVLLKVSPWKGVVRFGKKGKLAPRYVGPFEILERIGLVAYRLRIPEELNSKCLADASLHVPLDEIKVDKTLRFVEEPIEIMDHEIKILKRSKISLVKVRWNSKRGPEFTWEHEVYIKSKYP